MPQGVASIMPTPTVNYTPWFLAGVLGDAVAQS